MNKKVLSVIAVIALVVILGVCLVACNSSDYKKKLEKAGYTVVVLEGDSANEKAESDSTIDWVVSAVKMSGYVNVIKFANTDDAKAYENNAVTGGTLKLTCVRTGKIVIYGTEQAVKDAK